MSAQGVLGLLGIAQASGRIESGRIACEKAIARRRVYLVVVADDAGGDVVRRFRALGESHRIPCICFAPKSTLGQAIGKPDRSVVGVTDPRFAERLKALLIEGGWRPV